MQRHAVNEQLPLLKLLQAVNAPDQSRFSRSAGAADHHDLTRFHVQPDILQHMQLAESFVDALEFNHFVLLAAESGFRCRKKLQSNFLNRHFALQSVGQSNERVADDKI